MGWWGYLCVACVDAIHTNSDAFIPGVAVGTPSVTNLSYSTTSISHA